MPGLLTLQSPAAGDLRQEDEADGEQSERIDQRLRGPPGLGYIDIRDVVSPGQAHIFPEAVERKIHHLVRTVPFQCRLENQSEILDGPYCFRVLRPGDEEFQPVAVVRVA